MTTTEVVSHYTERDRAALHAIFDRLPGAIPVACKGSAHGGDPSDWDDHMEAKAPFLHATGQSYKWKMQANVDAVRAGLDGLPLVGIGLQSAGLAALDDDQSPSAPPLEGLVGIPSRDPLHRHWLCKKGPGAWRDAKWRKDGTSGGEVKQKGFICIWHPVELLRPSSPWSGASRSIGRPSSSSARSVSVSTWGWTTAIPARRSRT